MSAPINIPGALSNYYCRKCPFKITLSYYLRDRQVELLLRHLLKKHETHIYHDNFPRSRHFRIRDVDGVKEKEIDEVEESDEEEEED